MRLSPTQAERYTVLYDRLCEGGVLHDLDDPADRAIVNVTLSPDETRELLSLHDLLRAHDLDDLIDTKRTTLTDMERVA